MSSAGEDDTALVRSFVRTRSEADFRRLYRAHEGPVQALARRLVGDAPDLVEDVLQETWMRAVQKIEDFEHRSRFRTWISGIAFRCAQEALRGRPFPVATPAGEAHPAGVDAAEPERPARDEAVQRALERLPFGYRQAVVLHDVQGHTHAEIAGMLGVSEGTSKSQLSRARSALRQSLSKLSPREES